jgi:hypothetical protein
LSSVVSDSFHFIQPKHQLDILYSRAGSTLAEIIEPGDENGMIEFIVSENV